MRIPAFGPVLTVVLNSVRGDVQPRKLYRVVVVGSIDPTRQAGPSPPTERGDRLNLNPHLVEARFVRRLNRFAALMDCQGARVQVHIANSGRLAELLSRENRMFLAPADTHTGRKTAFDLTLVEVGGVLVSVDARAPNSLLQEAVERGVLTELSGYDTAAREVRYHDSRLDMMLTRPGETCYVEAKSVTLVEGGVARFPDAPTERGRKHVGLEKPPEFLEMRKWHRAGYGEKINVRGFYMRALLKNYKVSSRSKVVGRAYPAMQFLVLSDLATVLVHLLS